MRSGASVAGGKASAGARVITWQYSQAVGQINPAHETAALPGVFRPGNLPRLAPPLRVSNRKIFCLLQQNAIGIKKLKP